MAEIWWGPRLSMAAIIILTSEGTSGRKTSRSEANSVDVVLHQNPLLSTNVLCGQTATAF